jgi:hypothetical protein
VTGATAATPAVDVVPDLGQDRPSIDDFRGRGAEAQVAGGGIDGPAVHRPDDIVADRLTDREGLPVEGGGSPADLRPVLPGRSWSPTVAEVVEFEDPRWPRRARINAASGPRPDPPVAGMVRLDRQGRVRLPHPGQVVRPLQ